jgi:two-component system repressor protein LuxO
MTLESTLPLVVIIDDETEILSSIKRCLMRVDAHIESFTSPLLALEFIETNQPAMVISDHRMPSLTGLECLSRIKDMWPSTKRVMLSAYQEFDVISTGFNQDIIDKFIAKPWKNLELIMLVNDAISNQHANTEIIKQNIIGESLVMQTLYENIAVSAGANVPIFIHGETGSGKELVAKACHEAGCRRNGDFIAVNCANFSENLIESQLFGHKKGAFTGAVANQEGLLSQCHGGTLFLDEITTLPLALQAKLLRVIQEREFSPVGQLTMQSFDAQIISASSVHLMEAVNTGDFREDLYYRLNVIPLNIPPLRDREQDVLLLAQHFLKKFSAQQNKQFEHFSKQAQQFIKTFSWPGNIRQLENTIHSLCIMNTGKTIELAMINNLISNIQIKQSSGQKIQPISHQVTDNGQINNAVYANTTSDVLPLELVEKIAIENAIAVAEGNITKAASLLEVNPSTIYRKMQKWQQ